VDWSSKTSRQFNQLDATFGLRIRLRPHSKNYSIVGLP